MAFVFETERSKLFSQKKATKDIGPGQYLPISEFKFNNPEIVPFGVAAKRQFFDIPQSMDVPGPGSYYHDISKEKFDKILKNAKKSAIKKEGEIVISKNGVSYFQPKKGIQERAIKRSKNHIEYLGFSSKEKRFNNKMKLNTPGPGTYEHEKNNEVKLLQKKLNENKSIIEKTNKNRHSTFQVDKDEVLYLNYNKNLNSKSNNKKDIKKKLETEQKCELKYRVSSIPPKNSKGYIIEESTGKLMRKENPDAFKIFSGDKDDMVGPGSYEISFPEDWKKTGTSWSKYKWEKNPKKIRPKSSYNVNNINCQIGNYREDNKVDGFKTNEEISNFYKSYVIKQLNYKDPTAHNIDTIIEVMNKRKLPSFIPMNGVPGPGFYYDNVIMDGMRKAAAKPHVEKKPYNIEEELYLEFYNNINRYNKADGNIYDFKKEQADNFKKKMLEKLKHKNIPFLSKAERFGMKSFQEQSFDQKRNKMKGLKIKNNLRKNNKNDSLQLSNFSSTNNSSFHKGRQTFARPKSMSGKFYRNDIRFRERTTEEKIKNEIPGPGSYINPFTGTGKSNSIKINGRYMDIRTCVKLIEKNKFNDRPKTSSCNINQYQTPGVGSYEPESLFTVEHDIRNNMKQGNRTFNSTLISDRNIIYRFQKNSPNGPGSYFQNINNIPNIIQNQNAFNMTTYRFRKGGKNNTKEYLNEKREKKSELNAIVSSNMNDNIKDKNEYQTKSKKGKLRCNSSINRSFKNNEVTPWKYEYISDIYPWIKPSFNSKYS